MKYGFKVELIDFGEEKHWVAKSKELYGCVAQGDTVDEAIQALSEGELAWLESAEKYGIVIPDPIEEKPCEYSGKILVRMSSKVHELASSCAREEGISLNQYINDAIVEKNTCARLIGIVKQLNIELQQGVCDVVEERIIESQKFRNQRFVGTPDHNPYPAKKWERAYS